MKPRILEHAIRRAMQTFPAVIITGPRQSGKTTLLSEWVKAFNHRGNRPELYYWRNKAGLEIDLLIDRNQHLFPLETKEIATLLPGHAKALKNWRDLAGENAANGVIVANIDSPMEVSGCRAISWKYAM